MFEHICYIGDDTSDKYNKAHKYSLECSGYDITKNDLKEVEIVTFESRKYKIKLKCNETNALYSFNNRISYDVSIIEYIISLFDNIVRIDALATNQQLCKVIIIHNIHYLTLSAHKILARFMKDNMNSNIILVCTTLTYGYNLNTFISFGKFIKCTNKSELMMKFENLSIENMKPYWQETIDTWFENVFSLNSFSDIKEITEEYVTNCYNLWITNISFNIMSKYIIQELTHKYLLSEEKMHLILQKSCEIDYMLKQKYYHTIIYYQTFFNYILMCIYS